MKNETFLSVRFFAPFSLPIASDKIWVPRSPVRPHRHIDHIGDVDGAISFPTRISGMLCISSSQFMNHFHHYSHAEFTLQALV